MRSHQLRLMLVLLLAVGMLAAVAGPASAGNLEERPFHFSEQADFYWDGECMQITGTGIGSHLGMVTITGQECPGTAGAVTWTAASGDEISIVFTSVMGPIGADGSAPIEFYALEVSGTGRFENVQLGDGPLAGTIWFYDPYGMSGHLETEINSTIIYDASDRSN